MPGTERDVEGVLAALSLDERALLGAGADMWTVPGIPAHGIPAVTVTDGPNGARGSALLGAGRVSAACLPCGTALAATWDPALLEEVGAVLGEEARTKSARVLLAPTVNLPRSPLWGRSFECLGEDPLLSGRLAAAYVRGVQSRGVAATLKHLVGNEAEFERTTISSDIDERALRELYLVPFEMAVREGGALAVMTGYNRLNGTWCAEDRRLLTGILRGEWGFDGVVMTDWYAVGSTVACAEAGLDLQMPGPARFYGAALAAAVRAGEVEEAVPERTARRWLTLIDRLGAWDDRPEPERAVDLPAHREVARRAAAEGTVLLRNDGTLPLRADDDVVLIGPNAARAHVMGGGSAQLRAHRLVSPAEALAERLGRPLLHEPGCLIDRTVPPLAIPLDTTFRDAAGVVAGRTVERDGRLLWWDAPVEGLDPSAFSFTARGTLHATVTGRHTFTLVQAGRARLSVDGRVVLDGFADVPPPGTELFGLGSAEMSAQVDLAEDARVEVVVEYDAEASFVLHGVKVGHRLPDDGALLDRAVALASAARVPVVVVGTSDEWETEGHDRADLALPGEQAELVRRVCAVNPRTVVVVNAGAPVDLTCADRAAALVVPWLGGQEMADALADVLLGHAEPAGRLPVTFPLRLEHTPAYGSFPGANHHVAYAEGVLAGYRWYDTRLIPTAFPFGHGGSFTTWAWGPPVLSCPDLTRGGEVVVEVAVTNTGDRPGSDVVQLFVEPPPGPLFRPRRELKAFAKVRAAPGETVTARLVVEGRAFAAWDPGSTDGEHLAARLGDGSVVPADRGPTPVTAPGWYTLAGPYALLLARSVEDVVHRAEVTVTWSGPI